MQLSNICIKRTATAVIKTMLMVALFTAVILFAKISAYADADTALTVRKDGETVREFTLEELQQIATEEGNKEYSYSAWNVYPTFSEVKAVKGPTVEAIFNTAGIGSDITDTCLITFTGYDGYYKSLTGKQLFKEKRNYFPNGNLVDQLSGIIPDASYTDAVEVPAVISIQSESDYKFRLFIGQVAPNEQNNPVFVQQMASGGTIELSTEPAPKCTPVTADPENLTTWRAGKEITLTSKNNYEYDKIYYTFEDGAVPDYGCAIYNCGPKQEIELKPVISAGVNQAELKVVVKGYGKQDSEIQKFVYKVGEPLTVKVNGETVKTYDRDELDVFALADAGSSGIDYSGYNSFPSFQIRHADRGYRVDSIIADAAGKDVLRFDADSTVKFTGSDGYSSLFTIGQLFGTERYYYPNAKKGTDAMGSKALPEAYKDSKPVPAIIECSRESQLLFGQAAPNEQNHSEFVSYMLQGGTIEINDTPAAKCDPVAESYPSNGSVIGIGEKIKFPMPETYKNRRDKLYYIIDPANGELPGNGCDFYFYGPYHWPEERINPPVLSTAGHHTIATRITGYGKQDSDVKVFDFYVKPAAPAGLKATANTYNTAKLTWNAQRGVSGYRIYRSEAGGTLTKYKDIGSGQTTFTDKGLKTGTAYKYAVSALAEGKSETLVSGRSGSVSVKPALGKTTVTLTAGVRKIKVKWKKVSGASGYVIMRSTKKSSGYKKVKTITKGSTVSFINTKLKKGQKYYYKVRAYRNVSGKKVYGSYSAVKAIRAK